MLMRRKGIRSHKTTQEEDDIDLFDIVVLLVCLKEIVEGCLHAIHYLRAFWAMLLRAEAVHVC